MNRKPIALSVVVVSLLANLQALGQSAEEPASRRIELQAAPGPIVDQFYMSYMMGFNFSARLRNLGNPSAPSFPAPPPPPGGPFVSATGIHYRDGYVGIDSSGNLGGTTWYWGYARSDQIQGDNLLLSRSGSGTIFNHIHDAPQHGVEIGYRWRYRESDGSKMGVEASFSFMDLDLKASGAVDPRILLVHAFGLGGIVPPAPYIGTYEGPRAVIDAIPKPATIHLVSEFDGEVYGFKVGPYAIWPLNDRVSFTLSGGFALLLHDSDFRLQQSVSIPGGGTISTEIIRSDLGLLPGGYIAGALSYKLSDQFNCFTSLQYQNAGRHTYNVGDIKADINFDQSYLLSVGFSYLY